MDGTESLPKPVEVDLIPHVIDPVKPYGVRTPHPETIEPATGTNSWEYQFLYRIIVVILKGTSGSVKTAHPDYRSPPCNSDDYFYPPVTLTQIPPFCRLFCIKGDNGPSRFNPAGWVDDNDLRRRKKPVVMPENGSTNSPTDIERHPAVP